MKEDMEKAYSLVRMEMRDEEDDVNTEKRKLEMIVEEREMTSFMTEDEKRIQAENQEKIRKGKEEAAKTRQIYNPIEKTYDERKRRVTDLAECSRVTLPKPLTVRREAEIETRRNIHDRIYQEYRKEKRNDKGEQESNVTWEERTG